MVTLGTFGTKADADRAAALAVADQTRGAWVDLGSGRRTVADYAWAWLAERPKLRPRTRELYEVLLRLRVLPSTPSLGRVELRKLSPVVVRRWYSGLRKAGQPGPSTVAESYRLLHTVLVTAAADELIVKNPCVIAGAGIERSPERPVITVEQVWALADAVEPRYRTLVLITAFTGLRREELFGLTRGRLDLLHRTVKVSEQRQQLRDGTLIVGPPKTDAGRRTVALPGPLVPEIAAHLDTYTLASPDALVFTGERGGPLRDAVWQSKRAKARTAVGFPHLHFHDLRHVANTLTAASGASTRELMHRMGHVSPQAALRYQHATKERDLAIANALGELIARPLAAVTPLRPTATDG